ncbi:MAG: putative motility protein [Lachnospiraceae bacterium]|nr:putative motility protein [Lachnospiraceae bacterium]
MEISALSIPMYTGTGNTGLEIAMMSKALDTAEIAGDALTRMMEAVVTGLGQNMDIRA